MITKRTREIIILTQVSMRSWRWISQITWQIRINIPPRISRGSPNQQTLRTNSRKVQSALLWSKIVRTQEDTVRKFRTKRLKISMMPVCYQVRHQWTCHKLNPVFKGTLLLCRSMVRFLCLPSWNSTPVQRERPSLLQLEEHLRPDWHSTLT